MSNVISLHQRQVFLAAGSVAAYAKAYFRESGTNTQVAVYSDTTLLVERSQPVVADANGVIPVCYIGTADPLRILVTDEDDADLAGYPMDNITPLTAEVAAANTISFTPTEDIPETDVQAAIEAVAAQFDDSTALIARTVTPFVTGGTLNGFSLTPSPAITAYAAGQAFLVRPNRSNTGAATMNVNALGARDLQKTDSTGTPAALVAGDIQAGREFLMVDDGTRLLMALGRDYPVTTTTANGTSTRWSDGTQICRFLDAGTITADVALGSIFRSTADFTWTFPQAFSAAPQVHVTALNSGSWGSVTSRGTTSLLYRRLAAVTSASGIFMDLTAIGRWF